ncbi:hypothetical protein MKX01_001510 [Papaver californicum]|nr:hypothetical protein MKX01_001510 [Papaver californicum]
MDRYQRMEKPRTNTPISENEIRINTQGRMHNYSLRTYYKGGDRKNANEIVFKAMGRAINKTIMIVELIKRRIIDLHQITSVGSTDIIDNGSLETTRHVSMITITLSKKDLDASPNEGRGFPRGGWGCGRGRAFRGRGRGGYKFSREETKQDVVGYNNIDAPQGRGRGCNLKRNYIHVVSKKPKSETKITTLYKFIR